MDNKIISIIVTYNRKELLSECIEALLKQNKICDIMIIDNHSNDGTGDYIKNKYLNGSNTNLYNNIKIIYIDTGENLGGAGGYNFGLKEACKYDYDYFWLMDDDCIVNNNSLSELLDADESLNHNWSFLSSKVLWIDGSICKTNVQRKKVARKIKNFSKDIIKIDYASFVSLLIKKEDVLKYGLPIKDFYIWTDDLEYTRRLSRNTKKPAYLINNSIVTHKCKENIGVDISKDSIDRLDRYKYIYRNDIYTFKKEGIRGILFLTIRYIYHLFKIILSKKDIIKKINIMNKGHIDGLKFNPEIQYVK